MENVFLNVFTMKELSILFDVLNLAAVHSENAAGLVADDSVREEIDRYKSNLLHLSGKIVYLMEVISL